MPSTRFQHLRRTLATLFLSLYFFNLKKSFVMKIEVSRIHNLTPSSVECNGHLLHLTTSEDEVDLQVSDEELVELRDSLDLYLRSME